eukprot:449384_1
MKTNQLEALNVLSQFVRDHEGHIPIHPNELVSYSCSRYDLETLDYMQAESIIDIYTKNLDRLRNQKFTYKASLSYKTTKKKLSTRHKIRTPKLSTPKYKDVNDESETSEDIEEIIVQNIDVMKSNNSTNNITMNAVSTNDTTNQDTETIIYPTNNHRNCCSIQIIKECHKSTKMDLIVFIIWLFLMAETLFGVGFGLVRIGFGVHKLNESLKVTQEICYIVNYTTINCQYEDNMDVYNEFRYDYQVKSFSKCDNMTLYRRNDEIYFEKCGAMNYNMYVNLSCFVPDCDKNEYSLIGYQGLAFDGKFDIELGCIVLIMTTIPFISFICWLSFCYRCGPK